MNYTINKVDSSDMAILAMTSDPIEINKYNKNKQVDVEAYVTVDGDDINLWLGFNGQAYKLTAYESATTKNMIDIDGNPDGFIVTHSFECLHLNIGGYTFNIYRLEHIKDYSTGDICIYAYIETD